MVARRSRSSQPLLMKRAASSEQLGSSSMILQSCDDEPLGQEKADTLLSVDETEAPGADRCEHCWDTWNSHLCGELSVHLCISLCIGSPCFQLLAVMYVIMFV